jgi:lipoprotein-anchoring transpeptidase ErfK/SrfK
MGSTHDPLPIGDFTLKKPDFNPVFYYDPSLLWNEPQDNPKAKIAAGPNNPVGLCWIGLDKKHYGIHGTPDPSLIGKSLSHGCIRLTNWDVLDLAGLVKAGMEADLRQG